MKVQVVRTKWPETISPQLPIPVNPPNMLIITLLCHQLALQGASLTLKRHIRPIEDQTLSLCE